jgi:hypothetical protein
MIFKQYLNDTLRMFGIISEYPLCTSLFCNHRVMKGDRDLFEQTLHDNHKIFHYSYEYHMVVIDCLYSLRLVCKKMDHLLREKVKVVTRPHPQKGEAIRIST